MRTPKNEGDSSIKVYETEMVHLSALNPAPYNPRTFSPAKMDALKANIRRHGFVVPMVVQRHSPKYGPMVIVGGHQRQKAIREICVEDNAPLPGVPCIVRDLDDRDAKMLNVALNKVEGEFDVRLLGEVLEDVNAIAPISEAEVVLLGLEDDELQKYLKLADPPAIVPEPSPTFGRSVTLSLSFEDVRERDAVKVKLDELAEAQKKTTGAVVLSLLGRRKR